MFAVAFAVDYQVGLNWHLRMPSNIERFKADLAKLLVRGSELMIALKLQCYPEEVGGALKKTWGKDADDKMKKLPSFNSEYQRWYSEGLSLLRQLLPDRVLDFVRHYEKPKSRKSIDYENYRIEDALQGLRITRSAPFGDEVLVDKSGAIPHLEQQIAMIKAADARFESSLFEIRQLVQADLFDSELEAAESLHKNKFYRAAGALSGVVLEGHLAQVCKDRNLTVAKKHPGIAVLNGVLKDASVVDIPEWRFIQHLADIRNLCDHAKKPDPTEAQVSDLIGGVKKVIKSVF